MSNIISLEEWVQRKAIEAMIVLCGTGKSTITWAMTPSEDGVVKEPNK